jgi:putative transcriptional regulator
MSRSRSNDDAGVVRWRGTLHGLLPGIIVGTRAPARFWHPPASVAVRSIRARTGLSQTGFARRFGFTASAVREWEQGRRQPEASARVHLLVIARRPEVVDEALVAAQAAE